MLNRNIEDIIVMLRTYFHWVLNYYTVNNT